MLANWIRQTTTTTGTGNLTLASVTGYPKFNAIFGTAPFFYGIVDDTTGAPIETGIGHMSDATTLVRDKPLATMVGSTYDDTAPTAVNLAAGTKRVICVHEAGASDPALPSIQNAAGSRILTPDGLNHAGDTKGLAANTAYLSCLRWNCAAEITQLCCQVTTGNGTAGDRIQLGVYACNHNGLPGPLIIRTGDIAPNTAVFKSAPLSAGANFRLPPGWYWWAIASNVAPTVRAYGGGAQDDAVLATPMGHAANTINTRIGFFTAALTGGWTALPSTIALGSANSITVDFPPVVGAIVG